MTTWRPGGPVTAGERLPLPVLPRTPGMRGHAALLTEIHALGFRHAAQLLRPPVSPGVAAVFDTAPRAQGDEGFLVLDGLWFPARGRRWHRVDLGYLRRTRERWAASDDTRADRVNALLDTLETVLRDDPMGIRRIVLWQLCCLLKDEPADPVGPPELPDGAAVAELLGVHGSEAGPLAAAVARQFPAAGPVRDAAEEIHEVWPGFRLRHARRLAAALDPDPADPVLSRLLRELRSQEAEVGRLDEEASTQRRAGRPGAAARLRLRALRRAEDDPGLRAALLADAAEAVDEPGSGVGDELSAFSDTGDGGAGGSAVEVSWLPAHPVRPERRVRQGRRGRAEGREVTYRLVRWGTEGPGDAVEVRPPDGAHTVRDTDCPVGTPVRYAVLPLAGGRIVGVPRVSPPVLLAPDVARPRAVAVPEGVRLQWRADPSAARVEAIRLTPVGTGPGGAVDGDAGRDGAEPGEGTPDTVLVGDRHGVLDRPLPPGEYRYRVRCGYPGAHGEPVWSPGVTLTAQAEQWPLPVRELSVLRPAPGEPAGDDGTGGERPGGPVGDRVVVRWEPPARGQGSLIRWSGQPVAPGEDVSYLLDRPGGGAEPERPGARERSPAPPVSVAGAPADSPTSAAPTAPAYAPGGPGVAGPVGATDQGTGTGTCTDTGTGTGTGTGTDQGAAPHPAPHAEVGGAVTVDLPEPRAMVRMTAVSVLGGRAVAGPSVVLENPGVVTGLAARRLDAGRAEVWFDWPEPGVLVLLAWEQNGRREQRRLARSRYLAQGRVEIPVSGLECRITVSPLPRPDAVAVTSRPATVVLPELPRPSPLFAAEAGTGPGGPWALRNGGRLLSRLIRWTGGLFRRGRPGP